MQCHPFLGQKVGLSLETSLIMQAWEKLCGRRKAVSNYEINEYQNLTEDHMDDENKQITLTRQWELFLPNDKGGRV